MTPLGARPKRWLAVVMFTAAASSWLACDEPAPTEPAGLSGSEGRQRFIVTMGSAATDLEAWRALQRDKPDEVAAFVEAKRTELAKAQAGLDQVVAGLGGRVVGRWWMSGQATIEISPAALATVRVIPGVTAVEPDRPLQ
jgi:hypothetical protein